MNVLALDLGTKCGWATYTNGSIQCGTVKFDAGNRFASFNDTLCAIHKDHPLSAIAYEHVHRHAGTQAAHVYGGFWGILSMFSGANVVPLIAIGVGTIKKHATGKGNASKDQMIAAATAKWPDMAIPDDNAADALWILDWALTNGRLTDVRKG
jgi:Holliday junction resolvasome RuvABC endonuclease subunit